MRRFQIRNENEIKFCSCNTEYNYYKNYFFYRIVKKINKNESAKYNRQ